MYVAIIVCLLFVLCIPMIVCHCMPGLLVVSECLSVRLWLSNTVSGVFVFMHVCNDVGVCVPLTECSDFQKKKQRELKQSWARWTACFQGQPITAVRLEKHLNRLITQFTVAIFSAFCHFVRLIAFATAILWISKL